MNAPFADRSAQDRYTERVFESLFTVMELLQSDDGMDKICRGDIEHDPFPAGTLWKRPARLPPRSRRFTRG